MIMTSWNLHATVKPVYIAIYVLYIHTATFEPGPFLTDPRSREAAVQQRYRLQCFSALIIIMFEAMEAAWLS